MSGMFTTIFNPGLSVSDGSDEQATAADEGAYASDESAQSADTAQQAESGGSSSQSAGADADVDLGLEVTLSNDVQMTWTDDEGNVQSYSQSDEVTLNADVENTLDGLLTNEAGYSEATDYSA